MPVPVVAIHAYVPVVSVLRSTLKYTMPPALSTQLSVSCPAAVALPEAKRVVPISNVATRFRAGRLMGLPIRLGHSGGSWQSVYEKSKKNLVLPDRSS